MTKKSTKAPLRTAAALLFSALTLWTVSALAGTTSFRGAVNVLREETIPLALLHYTLGDYEASPELSFDAALALSFSPILCSAKSEVAEAWSAELQLPPSKDANGEDDEGTVLSPEAAQRPETQHADNGVPSRTLRPSDPSGYVVYGKTYINNGSDCALNVSDLKGDFSAKCPSDGPQVLIVHTHGTEAYTMPTGEEYLPSDEYRTLEEEKNMLRIGDEIASVLTQQGLTVLHDRTLHDYPNYSGAYNRSSATVQQYLEDYPSLLYVLDVHRDAVEDENGRSYKLLCAEEPTAAQMEFVLGTSGGGLTHDGWRENLKLACAVQDTILKDYPTLMRPIVLRNSRYNQHLTPGSLLIEVGTAGNSLDEALTSARIFAEGFAKTVLG